MRELAISISGIGFFVLSMVCYFSGLPMGQCALRAGIGTIVLYLLVSVALRMALSIFVDAAVKNSSLSKPGKTDHDRN